MSNKQTFWKQTTNHLNVSLHVFLFLDTPSIKERCSRPHSRKGVHGQSDRPGACSFAPSYCVSASTIACISVEDLLHFGDFGFYRWNCRSVSLDFFIGVTGECPDVQFSVGHLWLVTSPQFHFDRKWYCISTSAHHFAVFGTPRPWHRLDLGAFCT